jgi:hypothetical protein
MNNRNILNSLRKATTSRIRNHNRSQGADEDGYIGLRCRAMMPGGWNRRIACQPCANRKVTRLGMRVMNENSVRWRRFYDRITDSNRRGRLLDREHVETIVDPCYTYSIYGYDMDREDMGVIIKQLGRRDKVGQFRTHRPKMTKKDIYSMDYLLDQ